MRGYTRPVPARARVPSPTAHRLSLYLREVERLAAAGRATVSSRQLGLAAGAAEAQVRKDLGVIGTAGQPGVGYVVESLGDAIRSAIGVHRSWRAALVGAGNIGRALAAYRSFREEGFEIAAVFDADTSVVGRRVSGIEVQSMDALAECVRRQGIGIGIIAVPPESAQEVADRLVAAGVQGILNFAPRRVQVPDRVPAIGVDFRAALERLVLEVSQRDEGPAPARRRGRSA
jgi:redox-sensing transcriptional repressor